MNSKEIVYLFIRYLSLIVLGLPNLYLFYLILTPLTVYPVFWILSLVGDVTLFPGNTILIKDVFARIVPACVAGAAYYLLLILNLTTKMSVKTRVMSLVFLFLSFLTINILRISLFAHLFVRGYEYFDLTHTLTWYLGSTVLVIIIWFSNVFLFKIKSIPIYSDLKDFMKDIRTKN